MAQDTSSDVSTKSNNIKTFIFLDLEATGLPSSGRPRITELSLVAVHRCILEACSGERDLPRVIDKLTVCVCPMKPVTMVAADITGLHNDILEYEKDFDDDLIESINLFIKRHEAPVCLVAHNGVNFDFGLLLSEYESLDAKLPEEVLCIDSLNMLREIEEKFYAENIIIEDNHVQYISNKPKVVPNSTEKVKRQLFVPLTGTDQLSSSVNAEKYINENVALGKKNSSEKTSSLFDPIEDGEGVTNDTCNVLIEQDAGVTDPVKTYTSEIQNNDKAVHVRDTSINNEVINENKDSCKTFDGDTQEYSYEEVNIYTEHKSEANETKQLDNKPEQSNSMIEHTTQSHSKAEKPNKLIQDVQNTYCLQNAATNVCCSRSSDHRPISPGMEEALQNMISMGDFDDDDADFLNDDTTETSSNFAGNQIGYSGDLGSGDIGAINEAAPLCENQTNLNEENTLKDDVTLQSANIQKETGKREETINNVVNIAIKSPPPIQRCVQNIDTPQCSPYSDVKSHSSNTSTPPKPNITSSECSSKPQSPWYTPTRLSKSPFKKYKYSYKLMDIHKRIVGWTAEGAHRAEDDSLALLRICQKLCPHVCQWADNNAVSINRIPPLYPKSPKKRTPLKQGVFPYIV